MANEGDSRETTPTLRWGETALEVPDANVVEPSGGVKDVGWIPTVSKLIPEWLNWKSWAAGVFNRYVEHVFFYMNQHNYVLPGNGSGAGEVTAGVGLSVDVTQCRDWLTATGGLYKVPAVTNLALAAADPTDPRIDRVVGRVVAGVPTYVVITGTPAASPSAPSITAGDARHAQVRVNAAAVAPTTITDERDFGIVDVGTVEAQNYLYAGELGGGDWLFTVNRVSQLIILGDSSDPHIQVAPLLGGTFLMKPDQIRYNTAITRKYDIESSDFQDIGGSPAISSSNFYWASTLTTSHVAAAVRVPNGCTIVRVTVYGNRADPADGLQFQFSAINKITNVDTLLASADNSGTGSAGDCTLTDTLSHTVDQDSVYRLQIDWLGGAAESRLYCAEIEYTELRPFDGL